MHLVALTAARNEEWILGCTGRATLAWCDEVVFLNHASTDRTADIIADIAEEHPGRVSVIHVPGAWDEMHHRQAMLDKARERGATHCAYVDADELLTANLLSEGQSGQPVIREQIETLDPGRYIRVGMPCMWRSLTRWRNDQSVFGCASTMLAFADAPFLAWKPKEDGYQFHGREPRGVIQGRRLAADCGGLMHLQFSSWRRLIAKHALYQMTETLRWPNRSTHAQIAALYSQAPNEQGARIVDAPSEWFDAYVELFKLVDLEAKPWHEDEVARLLAEHGPERFAGLNLFGLENHYGHGKQTRTADGKKLPGMGRRAS